MLFRDQTLFQLPFLRIGAFSPALVSILLSSFEHSEKSKKNGKRAITFLITWMISSIHFTFYLIHIEGIELRFPMLLISIITAVLPAYVMSGIFSGNKSIREHLTTIIYPTGHFGWHLVGLILIPVVLSMDALLNLILGNQPGEVEYTLNNRTIPGFLGVLCLIFIAQSLQAGGLSEEPGWRGYALRNLQTRFSPLVSGTLVGFGWGFWHFPVYLSHFSTISVWMVLYQCFQLGIVFTWIYNRTKGSLLAVILLHASWNTCTQFIPKTYIFDVLMGFFMVFIILWDRMWRIHSSG